jgi:hypothetical protein
MTVDGRELDPRFDLRNHSPDGFEWGYGGSGPAQLALAILADVFAPDEVAQRHYQQFKFQVIAGLPHESWTLTSQDVEAWLRAKAQAAGTPDA